MAVTLVREFNRWTRPVSVQSNTDARIDPALAPGLSTKARSTIGFPVVVGARANAPIPSHAPEPFWLVFGAGKTREFRANKPCIRCLDRLAEWSFWNPVGSDRRVPKHTHAEQAES